MGHVSNLQHLLVTCVEDLDVTLALDARPFLRCPLRRLRHHELLAGIR